MITEIELKKLPKLYQGKFVEMYSMSPSLSNVVYSKWKGFFRMDDEIFRQESEDSINLIKEYNIKVLISDCSELKILTKDVIDWFNRNWYAHAYENGLLLDLIIDSECVFGQLSLNKLLSNDVKKEVVIKHIQNYKEGAHVAKLFLEEEKKTSLYESPK